MSLKTLLYAKIMGESSRYPTGPVTLHKGQTRGKKYAQNTTTTQLANEEFKNKDHQFSDIMVVFASFESRV